MAWCFTLRSFAQMYADTYGERFALSLQQALMFVFLGPFDVSAFADRLWGDIFFDDETRKFSRKQTDPEQTRTFVHFILDPLYKLYSQVVSEETEQLRDTLDSLGIKLKPIMFKMNVRPLLKAILDQFFGPSTGLVDMIAEHIPSPVAGSASKIERNYSGHFSSDLAHAMQNCDASGPTMVQITRLYHNTDVQSFRAFGRVMSGTVRKGMEVKVLGEGYSPEDEEDMLKAVVEDVWVAESR